MSSELRKAASNGDLRQVKNLIQSGVDINSADSNGDTALIWAAYHKRINVVAYLLMQPNISITKVGANGHTALMNALWLSGNSKETHEIVKLIVDKAKRSLSKLEFNQYLNTQSDSENSSLIYAVKHGFIKSIRVLIGNGLEIKYIRALHTACAYGQTEIASLLLENQASTTCLQQSHAIDEAVANKHFFTAIKVLFWVYRNRLLHSAGEDSTHEVKSNGTGGGNQRGIRGCDLEPYLSINSLHQIKNIVYNKYLTNDELFLILQSSDAMSWIKQYILSQSNERSALDAAIVSDDQTALELLINLNRDSLLLSRKSSYLILAIENDWTQLALQMIDRSINLDAINKSDDNALIVAVQRGNTDVVEALLAKGCCINHTGFLKKTALELAIEKNNIEIIKLLLAQPAIRLKVFHTSFLPYIIEKGNTEMVLELVQSGILNFSRQSFGAGLVVAAKYSNTEVAGALIKAGCDVNYKNKNDKNALMWAAFNNNEPLFDLLISQESIDVTGSCNKGFTVLMNALNNAERPAPSKMVEVILSKMREQTDDDKAFLSLLNQQSSNEWSALHLAARFSEDIVDLLLDAGITINQRNGNGSSELIMAATHGKIDIVSKLIHHGAYLKLKNNKGLTAIDSAIVSDHLDTAYAILQYVFNAMNSGWGAKLIKNPVAESKVDQAQHGSDQFALHDLLNASSKNQLLNVFLSDFKLTSVSDTVACELFDFLLSHPHEQVRLRTIGNMKQDALKSILIKMLIYVIRNYNKIDATHKAKNEFVLRLINQVICCVDLNTVVDMEAIQQKLLLGMPEQEQALVFYSRTNALFNKPTTLNFVIELKLFFANADQTASKEQTPAQPEVELCDTSDGLKM